ncbi:MAG: flippase family protein [Myxococcales bacterium]|nr:flippase family protein [Myxococcales bacterium]
MVSAEAVADAPRLNTQVNRGVAWAGAAQAVIALTDLLSHILVVRYWVGLEDLGLASAAITFYVLLDTAADFGVTSALIQRDDHSPERVSTVFWFNVLTSSTLFVLLLVAGPLYGHILGHPIVGWLLIAYGGKLVFQNVYAIPFALLRKEMRYAEISKARIVAHVSESVGRVVFAALGVTVWCWTLAALTRAFVFGVIMLTRHPFIPKLVFQPREVMPYVRFGLRTAASQILFRLYTSLDVPIVTYVFGAHSAGIYGLALFVVLEPIKTISNVVIDVAFPAFARLRANREGLIAQYIQFTRLNLIAVLPFLVIIFLAIPEILHVFYSSRHWSDYEIDTCVAATRILCVAGTLRALGFVGPPLLDGIGRPELTLRYMIVAVFAVPGSFLLGAWLLGDRYDLVSVAIAWAVGYPVAFGVQQFLVQRSIDLPFRRYLRSCGGILGCCLAGLLAGWLVSYGFPAASYSARLIAICTTALAITFMLLGVWQKITPRSVIAAIKG